MIRLKTKRFQFTFYKRFSQKMILLKFGLMSGAIKQVLAMGQDDDFSNKGSRLQSALFLVNANDAPTLSM